MRGNDLARTAPGRVGIEDNDLVIGDGGLELRFAGIVLAHVFTHRSHKRPSKADRIASIHTLRYCGHPY